MGDPTQQVFWFASRAFGITAMIGLAVSVALGLAMSGRLVRRPGLPAKLKHAHESLTLVTLALIVVHAGLLLFDAYLRPGLVGITVPFALGYRPAFTGIGIIAGWLTAILGLSFYARKWIGTKTWRFMHRFTILAYFLALGHAVGAGTDARSPWMIALLTGLTTPIIFAFTYRMLPSAPSARQAVKRPARSSQGQSRAVSATARSRQTGRGRAHVPEPL
jgi:sulfoxide reductase heme-binding subunit YedZ